VSGQGAPGYLVPAASSQGELREKGSRFLALVFPAARPAAAAAALAEVRRRHPDATHHCWASRLGPAAAARSSDGGEPAGTAGVPILRVLEGAGLSDAVCVVVRWFGGTKLGKGGLARAYAAAAREALAGLEVRLRVPTVELAVDLPYERLGAVRRLLRPPEVTLVAESYGERATLRLAVHEPALAGLLAALAGLGLSSSLSPPPSSDRVLPHNPSAGAGRRGWRIPSQGGPERE